MIINEKLRYYKLFLLFYDAKNNPPSCFRLLPRLAPAFSCWKTGAGAEARKKAGGLTQYHSFCNVIKKVG